MENNMKKLTLKRKLFTYAHNMHKLPFHIASILFVCILSSLFIIGCSQNNQQIQTEKSHIISADDARDYALNHAGLTESQATLVRSERDMDDGRLKYDVEFYTNDGLEYDYEIDSSTGKVLSFDIDAKE